MLTFRHKTSIPIGQLTNRLLGLFKSTILLTFKYVVGLPKWGGGVGDGVVDAAVHVAFYVEPGTV